MSVEPEEVPKEELEEILIETKDVKDLKLEIAELAQLQSFALSPMGKALMKERERQVTLLVNRLFSFLKETPDVPLLVSTIAQLKVACRDLVDFKGSKTAIENKNILLETLSKPK